MRSLAIRCGFCGEPWGGYGRCEECGSDRYFLADVAADSPPAVYVRGGPVETVRLTVL
jgi:hypothetical protein